MSRDTAISLVFSSMVVAWHLEKESIGSLTYPRASILPILHYGKYQGAILATEKGLIRMVDPGEAALELGNNFQSFLVARAAIAACASVV